MSFSTDATAAGLEQISEIRENRANELATYVANENLVSSDDNKETNNPNLDSFLTTGSADSI